MSKTRQARLAQGNRFTAEVKSEVLNLVGYIDRDQLSKIAALRKRRNDVVHEWYDPTRSQAQEALGFATGLCSAQFRDATGARNVKSKDQDN